MDPMQEEQEELFPEYEEPELDSKIPARYRDLVDSDSFEKFRKNSDWWD